MFCNEVIQVGGDTIIFFYRKSGVAICTLIKSILNSSRSPSPLLPTVSPRSHRMRLAYNRDLLLRFPPPSNRVQPAPVNDLLKRVPASFCTELISAGVRVFRANQFSRSDTSARRKILQPVSLYRVVARTSAARGSCPLFKRVSDLCARRRTDFSFLTIEDV